MDPDNGGGTNLGFDGSYDDEACDWPPPPKDRRRIEPVQPSCHDVSVDIPVALDSCAHEAHDSNGLVQGSRQQSLKHINKQDGDGDSDSDSSSDNRASAVLPQPDIHVVTIDEPNGGSQIQRSSEVSYPMPMDDFERRARANSAPCYLRVDPPSFFHSREDAIQARLRRNRLFLARLGRQYREEDLTGWRQWTASLFQDQIVARDFAGTPLAAPHRIPAQRATAVGETEAETQQSGEVNEAEDEGSGREDQEEDPEEDPEEDEGEDQGEDQGDDQGEDQGEDQGQD